MASRDFAFGAPTLHDLTVALTGAGAIDDVAAVVLGIGADVVDALSAHLSVVVQPGWRRDFARNAPSAGVRGGSVDRPIALDTPLSRALVLQRPQVFDSREEYRANFPHLARELERVAANSAITLPMRRSDGIVIGALTFGFPESGPMPPSRRSLSGQVAEQCSLALERALLLHREREAARRALRLQSTATRLAGVSHVVDLTFVLDDACREALGARRCVVYELTPDGDLVRLDRRTEVLPVAASSTDVDEELPAASPSGRPSPVRDATLLGGVVAIENSAQFEARYQHTEWPAPRATLALPLRVGSQTLGCLYATFDSARRFPPDERALAAALAEQVALALERCRLHEKAELQTKLAERERDRMVAITAALQDGLFTTDVSGRILEVNDRFCEIIGFAREQVIGTAPPYPWWPRSDRSNTSRFVDRISARILEDETGATNEFDVTMQRPDGSRMLGLLTAAPLHGPDGEVTGVVGTVKDVSARVRAERRLRVLQSVTADLGGASTYDQVAHATVDGVVRGLRAAAGAFFLQHRSESPKLLHVREIIPGLAEHWQRAGAGLDAATSTALRSGETVTIDVGSSADDDFTLPDGTERALSIPVRLHDDEPPAACVSLLFREARAQTPEDRALYVAISQQCGQALLRAIATEAEHEARIEAERSTERMRRLQQVTAALTIASDPQEVASAVTGRLQTLFGATGVALFAVDNEARQLRLIDVDARAATHTVASRVQTVPLESGLSLADAVRTQEAIWLHDEQEWQERYPVGWSTFGGMYKALVVLPLVVEDDTLGVLSMIFDEPLRISDDDRAVLVTLAGLAAQALHRAARFAVERNVATTLQQSLLPRRVETTEQCRIAVRYQPSIDELHVGGDWFDTFAQGADRLAVTVGDVVGRGLSAAACMGQLRSAIGVLALGGAQPADVLEQIDRFAEVTEGGDAATVAYAALDLVTGTLRYACAGHPPPLLITPGKRTEFLMGGRSWPLGIGFRGRPRTDASVRLQPGSTVVLYTDGLVERRGFSLDDRLQVLAAAAADGPVHDPERLADHLLATMLDEALRDDVAVLTLRYDPAMAGRVRWRFPALPTVVPEVRGVSRRWLQRAGVDGDDAFDIVVACDEACANAVEHGDGSSDVELELSLDPDRDDVVVTVVNRGGWRDPRPDEEQGHGLTLMKALMSSVDIDTNGDRTIVRMRRTPQPLPEEASALDADVVS